VLYQIGKRTFTAPWKLVGECVCEWWLNRILSFDPAAEEAHNIRAAMKRPDGL
jgi:hypothetical protein